MKSKRSDASSQASHWAAFAGNARIIVGVNPAYRASHLPSRHNYFYQLIYSI